MKRNSERLIGSGAAIASTQTTQTTQTTKTTTKTDEIYKTVMMMFRDRNWSPSRIAQSSIKRTASTDHKEKPPTRSVHNEIVKTCTPYQIGDRIGQGAFKTVYRIHGQPELVLQIQSLKDESDRSAMQREIFFAKLLGVSPHHLCPPVVDHLSCSHQSQQYGITVCERMDSDARRLGQQQSERVFGHPYRTFPALLFYESQIQCMVALAGKLSMLGVIHGDFKLDNILWKGGRVCKITDFGFSGTQGTSNQLTPHWGFTRHFGCPGDAAIEPTPDILYEVNLWQLFVSLSAEPLVFVMSDKSRQIRILMGFNASKQSLLSRQNFVTLQRVCPNRQLTFFNELQEEFDFRNELISKLSPNVLQPFLLEK